MSDSEIVWYTPETIALLKAYLPSPETMHKIMNPYCGQCMAERGRQVLKQINEGTYLDAHPRV